MRKRLAVGRGAAALVSTLAAVFATAPTLPAHAAPGICHDLPACSVVARVDVTGDGVRDIVAVASRGASGAPDRQAVIRVKTSRGRVVEARRTAGWFHGPLWQGAAPLDGRRGHELVVGNTAGAHTLFFSTLTWRSGHLRTLKAPGGAQTWAVDSSYSYDIGWHRTRNDRPGLLRHRVAERQPDGSLIGTVTTYKWRHGRWSTLSKRRVTDLPEHRARAWGGWRVPGLDRF